MFFNIAYFLLRLAFFPFFRIKAYGRENLPKNGGMLICANHTSLKDPIFVVLALGRKLPYAFMAKAELFKNPVFGYIVRKLGAFPVNRGKADVGSVKTALRSLKNGKALILFPEGTRVSLDEEKNAQVKAGACMLAVRGGAPVVPVYVKGTKRLFSTVPVIIGKPFQISLSEKNPDYKDAANSIMHTVRGLAGDA